MGFLDMFDKLDDIIYAPVKLLTDWASEPLKGREHRRQMERDHSAAHAEADARIKESAHEANVDMAKQQLEADLSMAKQKLDAELAMANKNLETDLDIKRATEIHRILMEIDEIRKDKELERMKAVSDAIMQYQEHLTRLNVNAINAIGHMQLDLREKAQRLVYEKTIKYKELQDGAHSQAEQEILRIERDFAGNETAKAILYKSVDTRLANIISTAQNFLIELNNDIAVLNKGINLLTERGQDFIQEHLSHFHVATGGSLLENTTSTAPQRALMENSK